MAVATAWSARWPVALGIVAVAILVGGFGYWAVDARIAGAIVATGQVEVERNRQVVQHPDGGVVEDIAVTEGDRVSAGDVLLALDPSALRSDLAVIEGQLFEIMARRARFEAERDGAEALAFDPLLLAAEGPAVADLMRGQETLFVARAESEAQEKAQISRRIDQIREQIAGIRAQEASLETQIALIGEELADQQSLLERGLAQASRVLALRREEASLAGQAGELAAAAAQAEGKITELEVERLRIDSRRREEAITRLRDLRFNEAELAERRRALIRQLDRMEIRAPVAGVVYGLTVFAPQSVIRPADPLLYIVPQDRPLVIAARIAPTDIDQVFPGQEVSLRFTALDQRRTPELTGAVLTVSADAFRDEGTGQSYYRAEIVLGEGELAKLPEGVSLVPGMPVDAFLRTEARSPLAYLLRPLTDYFARAFRES